MKKYIIGLTILLPIMHSVSAMSNKLYLLASQQVLKQRFSQNRLDHFIDKTRLDQKLGNQELYALGVAAATELALSDYNEYLKNPLMNKLMLINKTKIIKLILEDHPEAIKELQDEGLLD